MILLNGCQVVFNTFPNGETLLVTGSIRNYIAQYNNISFKYEDDNDLIKLMITKRYLDDFLLKTDNSSLLIYYMPYSRMDRTEGGSAFTLKYVSEFINSLNFSSVTIVEPHSDVTPALVNRSSGTRITLTLLPKVLKEINFDKNIDYIVFPDTTSNKRYSSVDIPRKLTGIKHRDFDTGKIANLEISGLVNTNNFKAVLIDDLCSYGGTFLLTAKKLKDLGAKEIYLLVGHCEDSIFSGSVFTSGLIDKVFTTNTIMSKNGVWTNKQYNDKLKVFDIEGIFNESQD